MNRPVVNPPRTALAANVHAFGGPDVIRIEETLVLQPGARQVLVRVQTAGVGPWDGWIRAGHSALPQPLPLTLGSDLSGVVVALGSAVTDLASGDEVFGVTNARFTGAYAQYALAERGMITRRPADLGALEAASFPVIASTALQMLEHAGAAPGQKLLIHGATGSVGGYAVQLAQMMSVSFAATARAADAAALDALGVTDRIDLATGGPPIFDAALDLVGGVTQAELLGRVRNGGRLISAVAPPDAKLAGERAIDARFILVDVNSAALDRLAEGHLRGELRARIGEVLPLFEARRAHEMLEGRAHSSGKIMLQVGGVDDR